MRRRLVLCALAVLGASTARAQAPRQVAAPPDTVHWRLEGRASVAEHQGRPCLRVDGGAATLKDFRLRDGVVDVDVSTPATRGFFGIQFRVDEEAGNGEWVYLRQHKSGLPDAMQYTPIFSAGLNWQIYSGPGFTGAVEIPRDRWFHLRLEVAGAQARLWVDDKPEPVLVMNDLKTGLREGVLALAVLTGETYFSNIRIRETADAAWRRDPPPMPAGTITRWRLSPSLDALARDLERPLGRAERDSLPWQDVEAEPPGFVVVGRHRPSPQVRVSFANDFSKRLEPQPGMRVVYATTRIDADRDQVRKLMLGYSDDVSVFLNGRILWRGRSAQNFRDPGFLGIVSPENDAIYLPLRKGANDLVLALSELGGGWGFIARLADPGP